MKNLAYTMVPAQGQPYVQEQGQKINCLEPQISRTSQENNILFQYDITI